MHMEKETSEYSVNTGSLRCEIIDFLGGGALCPRHMEVPGAGVESELKL